MPRHLHRAALAAAAVSWLAAAALPAPADAPAPPLAALPAAVPADADSLPSEPMAKLSELTISPLRSGTNLLPNAGFEEVGPDAIPRGWAWDRRNTDATCQLDDAAAHGGKRSLLFTSGTPFGAHVYGTSWTAAPVRLEASRSYAFSAWVLSDDPGAAWIGGGAGWRIRLGLPRTGGRWRLVSTAFVAGADDVEFTFRINVDSATPGFRVDDVKLEAGDAATPSWSDDGRFRIEPRSDEATVRGDGPFQVEFDLAVARDVGRAVLEASLGGAPAAARREASLPKGLSRVVVYGATRGLEDAPRPVGLRLLEGGEEVARGESSVRFLSASGTKRRLETIRSGLESRRRDLAGLRTAGHDVSRPGVALAVEESFLPWIEEDLRRDEVARAVDQVRELEAVDGRLRRAIEEARSGARPLPESHRWTGRRRPRPEGLSFVGPAVVPSRPGDVVDRPIFFVGYGAFGQVRADVERLPDHGANIVQVEFGPSSVFPREDEVSREPIEETLRLLDRAARAGVAVNLLVSPHYFPAWMLEQHPRLRKRREGFLGYCLHAEEGRDLLVRFLREIVPPLKDHPALHSICLSNEPVNLEEPCEPARRLWHEWLRRRHGDAASLNGRWGTSFTSIDDAPLPDPFAAAGGLPDGLRLDFALFNREFFAGWHAAMAEEIRRLAPELPVHAKAMTWTFVGDGEVRFGVDAELFGAFSDVNGNDSVCFYGHGQAEFAQGWSLNAVTHDLQRSVRDAPIFNSENHLIPDRETRPVPPEHIRAALWQAAVHGQSATTIWVWERTYDPRSDFAGSILHRPACVEAAGTTCLDLNRLAPEMTALQRLAPQAAILFGEAALIAEGASHADCRGKLHAALSFTGLKVGFVTERQLARGAGLRPAIIFVPNARRLSDGAFRALSDFGGKLVLVGDGPLLDLDEYGRAREGRIRGERIAYGYGKTGWRDLWTEIAEKLPDWGVRPEVDVRGAEGERLWGVEWLSATAPGGLALNLCSYRNETVEVRLERGGRPVAGRDLISGDAMGPRIRLRPLETRLIRIEE